MEPEKEKPKPEGMSGLDDRVAQLERHLPGKEDHGYQTLLERISALEKKVADLKELNEQGGKSRITENTLPSKVIPGVRKTTWSDFKNWYTEDDARYAIEALYVGADLSDEIRIERQRRQRSTMPPSEGVSNHMLKRPRVTAITVNPSLRRNLNITHPRLVKIK
ncbi:hypothetical protein F4860DRAFT_235231 [Xylaria cubensis]|nr:hypothetical protein F4860DRAFT_235231 [Xylaria cubensis]